MDAKGLAVIVVSLVVGVLSGVFAVVGYFAGSALGIPSHLHLPATVRATGVGVLAFGLIFMGWVFSVNTDPFTRRFAPFLRAGYVTRLTP